MDRNLAQKDFFLQCKTWHSIRCQITPLPLVTNIHSYFKISFSHFIRNYISLRLFRILAVCRKFTFNDCILDMFLKSGRCTSFNVYRKIQCCIIWLTNSWFLRGIKQRWTATRDLTIHRKYIITSNNYLLLSYNQRCCSLQRKILNDSVINYPLCHKNTQYYTSSSQFISI